MTANCVPGIFVEMRQMALWWRRSRAKLHHLAKDSGGIFVRLPGGGIARACPVSGIARGGAHSALPWRPTGPRRDRGATDI